MGSDCVNSDVVVVVPALNEANSVGHVVTGLRQHFPHVICVDDGSCDDTSRAARVSGATVLRHPRNLGQGAALQTGFAHAMSLPAVKWVITFDSDGQHRVPDALRLLEVARLHQVDVVLGSRFLQGRPEAPPLRRALLRAGIVFTRLTTRMHLTDTHNGLRVLSRRAVESMNLTLSDMAHASQMLGRIARHQLRWVEAPVTIDYTTYSRSRGQSNLNALNIVFDLAVERMRGLD
jgi:glycosyltransferase involved in cell wall biosynthesis